MSSNALTSLPSSTPALLSHLTLALSSLCIFLPWFLPLSLGISLSQLPDPASASPSSSPAPRPAPGPPPAQGCCLSERAACFRAGPASRVPPLARAWLLGRVPPIARVEERAPGSSPAALPYHLPSPSRPPGLYCPSLRTGLGATAATRSTQPGRLCCSISTIRLV